MTAPPQTSGPNSGGAQAACMVVHAPTGAVHPVLREALARHGLGAEPTPSPHRALARAATGRARVVLIADPERVPDATRLARALRRFAPGVPVWEYRPGANPPVRAFVEPQAGASPALPGDPGRTTPPRSGMLRLIESSEAAPPPEEETARGVLSADELAMLLPGHAEDRP